MTSNLPDPHTAPELFAGLLFRRSFAYLVDVIILSVMVSVIMLVGAIAGFATLGATWLILPVAVPLSIAIYYGATLGSYHRATLGMRMMDIVLTPARGKPLNGLNAFWHPVVFWLTIWILTPFSFLFALFTPRRQLLHDLIVGTLMVRRSPMEQHWAHMPV